MNSLNILVTGASIGGIGFETAKQLAASGHRLIISSRTDKRARDAADLISSRISCIKPEALVLDLSDSNSISRFAKNIAEKNIELDVMINNAGFMKTTQSFSSSHIEMSMAVNYFGTKELTEKILPLMKSGSRIINVSSRTSSKGKLKGNYLIDEEKWDGFQAYFNSKQALNIYSRRLAFELKDRRISVNALHPRNIVTKIWTGLWPQYPIVNRLISIIGKWRVFSVGIGAETSIFLAVSSEVENLTDGFYNKRRLTQWPKNCRNLQKNEVILSEFHQYHTV